MKPLTPPFLPNDTTAIHGMTNQDDLKDLGFPKGPRIKLLHEVQNLKFTPRT